ncbi:MAG: hypothetical protein ACJA0H_002377 [Francisellaceae bacterium]|jgi:hypothetical protein
MENKKEYISEVDKELYGALLLANERISSAGGNLVIVFIILGIVISFGVHGHWIERWIGVDLASIHNWYFYISCPIICFLIAVMLCSIPSNRAYKRYRPDILRLANQAGMSQYRLIAMIGSDKDLKDIADCLKKDTSLDVLKKM